MSGIESEVGRHMWLMLQHLLKHQYQCQMYMARKLHKLTLRWHRQTWTSTRYSCKSFYTRHQQIPLHEECWCRSRLYLLCEQRMRKGQGWPSVRCPIRTQSTRLGDCRIRRCMLSRRGTWGWTWRISCLCDGSCRGDMEMTR